MALAAVATRPNTKKAQREASVEGLLAAARSLFVSQGYRHTTVDEIAVAAHLTKGAVYFYFRNKEALLAALLDRVETVVVGRMTDRIAAAGPAASDRLVAFMHGQAQLGVESAEDVLLLILMSLEFAGKGGPIEARIRAIYERLYKAVESIIAAGKRRGEFRGDLRTREQAAIVMALHDGTFLEWYRRRAALDGPDLVRALRTSMLSGLLPSR
ncbi:MAG: TetR/AcrR family transcriptional regulator [Rhodospirillaceae bacterium]|nr:TetR/AcrR family transcriptional regulator [Rhodospirillaceae bacterium]